MYMCVYNTADRSRYHLLGKPCNTIVIEQLIIDKATVSLFKFNVQIKDNLFMRTQYVRTQTNVQAAAPFFDSANFAVVTFARTTVHKRNLCRAI